MSDPLEQVLAELGPADGLKPREHGTFDAVAAGASDAVIFGSGALGRILLTAARASGVKVVAFADNKQAAWNTRVEDVPVLSPADAVARFNGSAWFLIGIFNSAAPMRQLRELGARRIVPYPAFYWKFAATIPWAPGIELPSRIVADAAAVRKGYACLDDDKSREEFASQIAWRCTLDYGRLPPADPGADIYYAPELVRLTDHEVMVDCGAFDGDSIRLFASRTRGRFSQIYACEPDAKNRRALAGWLDGLTPEERRRVTVLPYAVGDKDGVVYFQTSGTAGSHMTADASTDAIDCRRLDTLMADAAPTFIKMDIEGAEPDALAGASATLARCRPIMAVCAYHVSEHLWTLPAILKAAVPDYRISLRRYAEECWEMVYYAVPPERAVSREA
jgi:FkbM family methyltransferase